MKHATIFPKLQAIKNIIAQPELFNLELPYVANEASFAVVAVPEGIDLAAAAEFAEMPLEEFVALNPGFNRPVITVPGRSLVVPLDRVEQFQERLAEWPADEKGWRLYKVKNGETLANIARQHHLSLTQLRELNGLTPKSKISPGYAILVPDGVDPDGALKVSRLLPRRERLAGQSNLKVSKKKAVFKGKVGRNKAVQAKKPASKKSGQASNKKAVVKKKSTNQGKNKKKRQQIL